MKRTLALLLACALGLSLLSGCAQASPAKELTAAPIKLTDADMTAQSPEVPGVYAALSGFGLELLQKTREAEGTSTLVSPLSVALALSMTANGADGNTLAQFEALLGDGASIESVNAACQALTTIYRNLDGSTQCSIANSLWVDPEGQIREDFTGKCRGLFDAQVFQTQLSDPGIVKDLNGWVSGHTNKLIPKIIDEPFSEETALLLANALYLKNTWAREFDPLDTYEMDFHHGDGSDSRVDYLQRFDTQMSYLSGEGAQGAVLPYDDGRLAFFVLLPDLYPDAPDFGTWLGSLEGDSLTRLLDSREDTLFLRFSMPKFTAEWNGNLKETLAALGLGDALLPEIANFSQMGDHPDGYFISQVIHATRIEVNEKGTEAAAVTVVEAEPGAGAPPPEGVTLILDRPFLYGIVDLQNGVPLFLGTYE